MSTTCNQQEMETLGSWPIMPQNPHMIHMKPQPLAKAKKSEEEGAMNCLTLEGWLNSTMKSLDMLCKTKLEPSTSFVILEGSQL